MTAHIIPHPATSSSLLRASLGAVAAPPSAAPGRFFEYGITGLCSYPAHPGVSLPFVSIRGSEAR